MTRLEPVCRIRAARLAPRPGVYAEIIWIPLAKIMAMPLIELEHGYRFRIRKSINFQVGGDDLSPEQVLELLEAIDVESER